MEDLGPDRILCIVLVSVCGLVKWPMVVFEVTLLDFLPGRVLLLNTLFIFEVTLLHFDYRPGRPLFKSLYYILILKSLLGIEFGPGRVFYFGSVFGMVE